jgi:hypothetical protein
MDYIYTQRIEDGSKIDWTEGVLLHSFAFRRLILFAFDVVDLIACKTPHKIWCSSEDSHHIIFAHSDLEKECCHRKSTEM